MDDVVGYIFIIGFLILLMIELIRQIREYKVSTEAKRKNMIMIITLLGFVLFFSLNVLIATGYIAVNQWITSNSTALGAFICFVVHIFVKFRPRKIKV